MNGEISYASLVAGAAQVSDTVEALYMEALGLVAPRPIVFEWKSIPGANGAVSLFRDRVKIWLKPGQSHINDTIGHELAHVIIGQTLHSPRLNPNSPTGSVRQALSNLINIPEHILVHKMLVECGLTVPEDIRARNESFLNDIHTVPMDYTNRYLGLSIGYATMTTVYRDEELFPVIRQAMQRKSAVAERLGKQISEYVLAIKDGTLYDHALALIQIADITPQFRACVLSEAKFRTIYGWA